MKEEKAFKKNEDGKNKISPDENECQGSKSKLSDGIKAFDHKTTSM